MSHIEPQTPQRQRQHDEDSPLTSAQGKNAAAVKNEQSTKQNAYIPLPFPGNQTPNSTVTFQSTTTAPSPPRNTSSTTSNNTNLPPLNTTSRLHPVESSGQQTPLSAGLRIHTDIIPRTTTTVSIASQATTQTATESTHLPSSLITRTPSIKNVFANSIGSNSNLSSAPPSAFSSPMLNAMPDVTPLPSPLLSGDSPGPWKRLESRPASREHMLPMSAESALVTVNGESIASAVANQSKRRAYHGLITNASESGLANAPLNREKTAEGHSRNRSISDYVPDAVSMPKTRHVTVSGSYTRSVDGTPESATSMESYMRREPHLAVTRGLAPVTRPLTPPSSRTGGESSDSDSSLSTTNTTRVYKKSRYEYFHAHTRDDSKRRRWRALKLLGQGTFSKVILATSQVPEEDRIEEDHVFGQQMDGIQPTTESKIDRKKLVAIKICEHGPKGGASEERVEMSLKRELEIMKTIHHPSLAHLKAWNIEETRAILVLSYCPGGDLFEVASDCRDLLVPSLLRRMFAELVGAVRYLHERHIVHRDIKLENVLVNLPRYELAKSLDWASYPYSIVTLTDLGLSRRVADDEKLTTRCGSDDYAAPEVIMGQPYDGRATDAWSLGVLLYALLESRLPFDPTPGMAEAQKQRSRTSHRIARVEWRWIEYAYEDEDHEGDPAKFERVGMLGAMNITEGLLKRARSRWTLAKVAEEEWVKGGIQVEGGIQFREEDVPEEVGDGDVDKSPL